MTPPEGIETFDAVLPHGTALSYRAAGPVRAARRVLLLHGFPEAAFIWDRVMQQLLNYYRASPLRPPTSSADPIHTVALDSAAMTVRVPTTVLWGDADCALLPSLLDGLDAFVPELDVQRVPGATHWLVHEQPARVVAEIERLVGSSS